MNVSRTKHEALGAVFVHLSLQFKRAWSAGRMAPLVLFQDIRGNPSLFPSRSQPQSHWLLRYLYPGTENYTISLEMALNSALPARCSSSNRTDSTLVIIAPACSIRRRALSRFRSLREQTAPKGTCT